MIVNGGKQEWTLRLRIPAWSANTRIQTNFKCVPAKAAAGSYLEIRRHCKKFDEVKLQFDFGLRAVAGANEAAGKVSIYRGPLLLAYDQAHNTFDEDKIPAVNLARLADSRVLLPLPIRWGEGRGEGNVGSGKSLPQFALGPQPWIRVDLPTDNASTLRLVDFASAGTAGTRYRSWLPAINPPPPPALTQHPRDGGRVRPGPVQFQWSGSRRNPEINYRVQIAGDAEFRKLLFSTNAASGRLSLDLAALPSAPGADRWWRVLTVAANAETAPDVPPARFTLAADAPLQSLLPAIKPGPNGELVLHSLRGEEAPKFGEVVSAKFVARDAEGTRVNGRDQMLIYAVPAWPEEDFTVAVRVRIEKMPKGRIGQIFSAWTAGMDDPLRLVVDNGKLFARIEAGGGFGTPGVPVEIGQFHGVAAVKRGGTLRLFLDGQPAGSCAAPEFTPTTARDCALGGNPHFSGNEFLAASFAEFGLWERALSTEELSRLFAK